MFLLKVFQLVIVNGFDLFLLMVISLTITVNLNHNADKIAF